MSIETSKNVLQIAGLLRVIGAVYSLFWSIISIIGGGTAALGSVIESDPLLQQSVGPMLATGFISLPFSVYALVEGFVCRRAGKSGRRRIAALAMLMTAVSTAISILCQFLFVSRRLDTFSTIYSAVYCLVILFSANVIRRKGEA